MANCTSCGQEMGFSDRMNAKSYRGRCIACSNTDLETKKSIAEGQCAEKIQLEIEASSQKEVAISAVVLTTETAPNLNIIERIEIVTAECAYGMNIFKDLFAGVRDIVGGRSEVVQKTMRDARRTVLYELKKEAHTVGANAVVGVDLEYVELSAAGSMVMLVASGTAVIIED